MLSWLRMITKFWERTQTKFYLLLSSCSQCAAAFWENHWSEQPLVHREILRRRNIPAAISSLWDHYCNKLEKKKKQKTLLTQGSLQNDHILFLEARPAEAVPGYATKQAQHPDKTSVALSHLHPQVFSFAHHENQTAEWEFL